MFAISWPSGSRLKDELRISAPDFAAFSFRRATFSVTSRGQDAQARRLQRRLLFVARDRDAQLHLVALDFCVLRHAAAALRDAIGLLGVILHAAHAFDALDQRVGFFRHDQ